MWALNKMFCQLSHTTTPPQKPCLYFPHNCCMFWVTHSKGAVGTQPCFIDRIALPSANALLWDEDICWKSSVTLPSAFLDQLRWPATRRSLWSRWLIRIQMKMCKFLNSFLCPPRRWVVPKPTADWYPPTDNYESQESFSCHFFFVSVKKKKEKKRKKETGIELSKMCLKYEETVAWFSDLATSNKGELDSLELQAEK